MIREVPPRWGTAEANQHIRPAQAVVASGTRDASPCPRFPARQDCAKAGGPGFNFNEDAILSGTTVPGEYARVRFGQLDAPDVDGCCTDFVLAGPTQNHVKILFGTSSRGLLFLSDAPDQTFAMGPTGVGIEDIVVYDIDEDGHDNVLALRSDGVVGIRRGLGATAPASVLSGTLLEASLTFGMQKGSRSLAVTNLDCSGKSDLIAVSPAADGVVYALAVAGDTFSSPLFASTGVASSPRQLITGDVNVDGKPDLVTGNGDGSASVMLNTCSAFNTTKYPIFTTGTYSTPDMQVAIGRMCIGATSKDWPSIALGYDQRVFILCGNNTGEYDAIGEEPSAAFTSPLDYIMDRNPSNPVPSSAVYQLQYWETTQTLIVLWSDKEEFAKFDPFVYMSGVGVEEGLPVADLHGRAIGNAFAIHQSRNSIDPEWAQGVVLVTGSGSTDVSFAR